MDYMDNVTITSYNLPARVASYDADMEAMHPNRPKMIEIALELLPFALNLPAKAIDLGVGTGFFTEKFLKKFPGSQVIAIDGAKSMIDLAKVRLEDIIQKVDFRAGDFRDIDRMISQKEKVSLAFSSYALHHLNYNDKLEVIKKVITILQPGGWFINADLIIAESPEIEEMIQKIRVHGIVQRTKGADERFLNLETTRRFLDELAAKDGDQPLTLAKDLEILRQAGFKSPHAYWLEYREVVYGGCK